MWDLFLRLTGQLRITQGRVTGVDLAAAFVLADALGVNKTALAEFFPTLEAAIVRRVNEKLEAGGETVLIGGG